ncbi:Enoyl-CoA hydratase/isomerase [Mycolicibacterium rhodesiae JS60]|nr:Enoyl-CoA hydratase/isomerase [Mycolicibacterium rhodesiae JS60]
MNQLGYDVRGHVATVTLNRPHRRNAFTFAMLDAWADAVRQAEADRDVRVLILTGAGDAFCAGVDLDDFKADERTPLEERELLTHRVHQVALAMDALSKPAIAAVNGVAVGAGMDMALMCDIRLASTSARFSEGYVRVGLVPGDGGCYYLPKLIGREQALRMLWTGDFVNATEALTLGLVSEVHPDEEIHAAARTLAEKITSRAPLAVQMIKRAVNGASNMDVRTALDTIASHQAVVLSTRDSAEAFAAFKEGREPCFEGR